MEFVELPPDAPLLAGGATAAAAGALPQSNLSPDDLLGTFSFVAGLSSLFPLVRYPLLFTVPAALALHALVLRDGGIGGDVVGFVVV